MRQCIADRGMQCGAVSYHRAHTCTDAAAMKFAWCVIPPCGGRGHWTGVHLNSPFFAPSTIRSATDSTRPGPKCLLARSLANRGPQVRQEAATCLAAAAPVDPRQSLLQAVGVAPAHVSLGSRVRIAALMRRPPRGLEWRE